MNVREMVLDRLEKIEKLCDYESNKEQMKRKIYRGWYSDKLILYRDEVKFLKALCLAFRKDSEVKDEKIIL